jgi:hypothetical protein
MGAKWGDFKDAAPEVRSTIGRFLEEAATIAVEVNVNGDSGRIDVAEISRGQIEV